ncbi:MAG TPA: TIGR03000 domain-containing protein [Gemmataceae bacterium]|nr:TIGR03000 domain-containing protein [Gemmataceae bacterium]
MTDPNTATLTVRLPLDAELWFDETKMSTAGAQREFITPPLTPGKTYSYMVRARWTQNGRVLDQAHQVSFHVGQAILVDFLAPAAPSSKPPLVMEKAP